MDFQFSESDERFREEIAGFVESDLPWDWRTRSVDAEEPADAVLVKEFKKKLADRGWLTLAWPEEYGGQAAPHISQMIFNEEMAYRGVPAADPGGPHGRPHSDALRLRRSRRGTSCRASPRPT